MKKAFFFLLFFLIVVWAQAQLGKIPAEVTDAFVARYPHATHVEWRNKLHVYEAHFKLNSYIITASFSSKGEWEGSERELEFNQLPGEVVDGFSKSKYADREKKTAYEVQVLGKPLQYRINVQKSGIQKKNLYFDANGKLLKESIVL
ncbi:PepSY-like domain-containing protein [Parafilimonas sp.]|uniref:PepSY-like domain-containing protein n=1 Tax=Parafilimonas sp. TaxID=1969739 RepID=UPI0039E51E10